MASITAHCIVKNEERFVAYAIRSVIDSVEQVIVFDTGSTDDTVRIILDLKKEYGEKILFEEKGDCDKMRHTLLRQEMIDRTTSDWFLIVDGDEVWTKKGVDELVSLATSEASYGCIIAPYFLCVGDIYHHSIRGKYWLSAIASKEHAMPKIFRRQPGVCWNKGGYGEGDYIIDAVGEVARPGNVIVMRNKYWHASALIRSSQDAFVALGRHKQFLTFSLKWAGQGYRITEDVPEVFVAYPTKATMHRSIFESYMNALALLLYKCRISRKRFFYE